MGAAPRARAGRASGKIVTLIASRSRSAAWIAARALLLACAVFWGYAWIALFAGALRFRFTDALFDELDIADLRMLSTMTATLVFVMLLIAAPGWRRLATPTRRAVCVILALTLATILSVANAEPNV